jgi:putative acetyltransferase
MDFCLAPLEAKHVPAVKELIRQVWREHFAGEADPFVRTFLDRPEAFPDLDAWRDLYVPPFGHFLIALDQDRVVGTGGIRRRDSQVAEITRIFVLLEYRRQGLGRRIALRLLGFAREAAYRSIRLEANSRLLASHALYRSLGFREIPASKPGGAEAVCYMQLEL